MSFKLTYSTMFSPPEELHASFESAMGRTRAQLGAGHGLYIGGMERGGHHSTSKRNPADQSELLGEFAAANTRAESGGFETITARAPLFEKTCRWSSTVWVT